MEKLVCIYCGEEVKSGNNWGLVVIKGGSSSPKCNPSPTGRHMLQSQPPRCIYCGEDCKTDSSGQLWTIKTNRINCDGGSPNKKHAFAK